MPFGIHYLHDVERLSQARRLPVTTVFDVGAHTGETAVAVLRRFQHAAVFSFEPNPRAFEELKRNLVAFDRRAYPFPVALSNRIGVAELQCYGVLATCNKLEGQSPIGAHNALKSTTMEVSVKTVDQFCAEHDIERIDLLKIDVEGHDLAVVEGAAKMLDRTQMVYVEFNRICPHEESSAGALASIAARLESRDLKFIATYPELILTDDDLFVASNALFCR